MATAKPNVLLILADPKRILDEADERHERERQPFHRLP